jgi:UDP-N-acetylmuramoyl-tripeptide--D-alanyl-D-alanine ligase
MNTSLMETGELSQLLGSRYFSFSPASAFSSVVIDSRTVKEGSLFFALKGACTDGHNFIKDAFKTGAIGAVVESSKLESFDLINLAEKMEKDLIVVQNTLKGLQDSARIYIESFKNIKKVGITGSSGKTTTKEIAAAIISEEKNVVKTLGNLNSDSGLPISVFETRADHEVGIFELAMNRAGEIDEIANVLKPNIACITNIGLAHIEFFGTKDKIFNEKKCIFNYLKKDDIALIPANDDYANKLTLDVKGKTKLYGTFDELEGTRSLGIKGTEIIWAGEKIHFALPGKHSLEDAMAAIAIAKEIPVSEKAIKYGLESVKPLFGRLEIIKGRTTVIRDCYNANLESTAKSIEFCDSLEWQGKKVYVIADMLELGEASCSAHEKIGSLLSKSNADGFFLFGKEIEAAVPFMKEKFSFYTDKINDLSAALEKFISTGDLVLLKGSRGLTLERLTSMLTGVCND